MQVIKFFILLKLRHIPWGASEVPSAPSTSCFLESSVNIYFMHLLIKYNKQILKVLRIIISSIDRKIIIGSSKTIVIPTAI